MTTPDTSPITVRRDVPRATAMAVRVTPIEEASRWITRREAATSLRVTMRTVDRYLRENLLTYYVGPVPGRCYGIRIWSDDVDWLRGRHAVGPSS